MGRLGELHNMYSCFRPHRRDLEASGRRVMPRPGDIPGSRTFPGMVQDKYDGEAVRQTLGLEAHELFTQLVAQTNLVKIGPRNGLFTCFVGVEEGVLRVWREWLKDTSAKGQVKGTGVKHDNLVNSGKGIVEDPIGERIVDKVDLTDPRILWVSPLKNTGIRLNARERKLRRDTPILIRTDEDMPVTYIIEYDGTFLLIPEDPF